MLFLLIFAFMKIDDEIKQYKFESNLQKAIINLLFTNNWHRDKINTILKSFDLQPQHFNILRILNGNYPNAVSPGYIKQVMIDKGVDLTRMLDKLDKLNLIKRNLCPSNRRKIDLNLTDEGILMLQKLSPHLDAHYLELKNNLTEAESEQLSLLLDKLRG